MLLTHCSAGPGRDRMDSAGHPPKAPAFDGLPPVLVSGVGKWCQVLGAEGGDTEERNETALIDETYELREKKRWTEITELPFAFLKLNHRIIYF